MQGTSGPSVKVAVVGASGYTGAELLRLLSLHPYAEVISITSRQFAGKPLTEVFPHFMRAPFENLTFEEYSAEKVSRADVVFLCLPHRASFPIVKELFYAKEELKIIDFSADFRFSDPETYERVYGVEHTAKELFKESAYGLPEINREEIRRKRIIANPGCYPTSAILALYPAVKRNLIDSSCPVIVDSKSGVTGAGRKANLSLLFCEVNEGFKAYSVEKHRHSYEIAEKLNLTAVRFTPHLVPMNRGILTTVYFKTGASKKELFSTYREFYKDEFFVRLRKEPPNTKEVAGTNFCDIYITKEKSSGLAVVISAIDNIGKGASSQAVQNMNLLCGFPEETGLKIFSQWI